MATIVICDHRSSSELQPLLAVLARRGHTAVHLNEPDPKKLVDMIESEDPDVVYSDLVFEKSDPKDVHQYWGIRILAELKTRGLLTRFPFLIESKHIGPMEEKELVGTYRIPKARLSKTYTKTLKEVAQWIESFL